MKQLGKRYVQLTTKIVGGVSVQPVLSTSQDLAINVSARSGPDPGLCYVPWNCSCTEKEMEGCLKFAVWELHKGFPRLCKDSVANHILPAAGILL